MSSIYENMYKCADDFPTVFLKEFFRNDKYILYKDKDQQVYWRIIRKPDPMAMPRKIEVPTVAGGKCPVCDGRGCLEDAEPIEYIDHNGNTQIKFNSGKMPCPNPQCRSGTIFIPAEPEPK